mmetsp:Transcript_10990/g.17968  ORF Transcript_10990/g.17968 Transcript_10990/m.17968 type:complete len:265 (+) Transcript_10990:161-955(+)|eukprot:CAMPEP_0184669174 /NCGR_PEP_ID=MMETSP0308-20130426/76162_1 /TAXON_ID=38269 /ORGANISM="Gloeochaete witrockiana, Strain SAG 46.84" /LENGTH=264 /DNA_ID=CAMNT_0027115303 /DNA_START=111 /DNA_END=905 /DNA_ORIENTATION=-
MIRREQGIRLVGPTRATNLVYNAPTVRTEVIREGNFTGTSSEGFIDTVTQNVANFALHEDAIAEHAKAVQQYEEKLKSLQAWQQRIKQRAQAIVLEKQRPDAHALKNTVELYDKRKALMVEERNRIRSVVERKEQEMKLLREREENQRMVEEQERRARAAAKAEEDERLRREAAERREREFLDTAQRTAEVAAQRRLEESARYVDALRETLMSRARDVEMDVPLCLCGTRPGNDPRVTCAENCMYRTRPDLYERDLGQLIRSSK